MSRHGHDHSKGKLKKKVDNPLARARDETRTQQLWHKKSGGGFILFIRYYAHQNDRHAILPPSMEDIRRPPGDNESDSRNETTATKHDKKDDHLTTGARQRGESRASKRRRRKRKADGSISLHNSDSSSTYGLAKVAAMGERKHRTQLSSPHRIRCAHSLNENQHRLLQAFDLIRNKLQSRTVKQLAPFLEVLTLPLPLSFRIRRWLHPSEQDRVRADIGLKFGHVLDRVNLDNVNSIYRAKGTRSWQGAASKETTELKAWLSEHATSIARQELGSMLPVILLARGGDDGGGGAWIGPGSRVLDLCASPGSKTLQALEVISTTGKIKSNDINSSRLESLRDAVQRASPPNANRIKYSNLDASKFPIPLETKRFHTVLCDVPCSGDGTIRKDSHILPNWTPQTANALHSLQVRILIRALHCLRRGGVLCYSTCSMNPVENEAVVAAALQKVDHVELQSFPDLADFQLRQGLSNWSVADFSDDLQSDGGGSSSNDVPTLRWYDSYEEAVKSKMAHAVPSLWPPRHSTSSSHLHLDRCARLWPHSHDCGGFFVAFIRRTNAE